MSGGIAKEGEIVWARGFGWADHERGIPADAEGMYHLASLTMPSASTVLLQLVEEGRLDLDAPVSEFGIHIEGADTVRVWHLLSHASSPVGGATWRACAPRQPQRGFAATSTTIFRHFSWLKR
jgi:CubicO group peptidase (beta-lactamase class C family)